MSSTIIRFNEIEEFRALEPTEDTGYTVEGYAVVYEQKTNVGGWFQEIIKRGALDGADLKDVPLFIHHQQRKIPLARSRNNNGNSTMQLTVDEKGLFFRAELDVENNSEAKALYSSIKRKDITGMSFAFRAKDEKWVDLDKELPTREIHKFEKIFEISALYSPQYEGANINARSESLDSEDKLALENARAKELDNSDKEQLELEKIKLEKIL
ncbi:HK97 family phage prohead protease [Gracilibacillus saliphilus]|uniref:HK97 family phage prohead protease n=1 Tax=Gracilibacillus saliphilus TaxID=543890 RepID=UPI00192DA140|nr:HK97 family phage prohead protease [Gracilibacillus saliphilus]